MTVAAGDDDNTAVCGGGAGILWYPFFSSCLHWEGVGEGDRSIMEFKATPLRSKTLGEHGDLYTLPCHRPSESASQGSLVGL